ncbi:cytochrome P450 78A6-like [Cucumis melo var. makuwa]|uniref:Cytochrome P450 78A6-like n=1 Tax=Cucumis melo var. makuwa TaxID=1194695 RepID=A0A5D3DM75_CUCMM|nr:cytochrome P450 78A6-like [Cucumis melo var. makuwa]
MNLMTGLAHQKIASVAKSLQATRLMAFSLANTRVIVTCHPDIAKDILNSSVFADRPIKESAYSLMFNRAIGFAPYGVYWRTLRRIASHHLFSPKQIKSSESQRRQIASQLVKILSSTATSSPHHRIRQTLKTASLNNMMGSVFGRFYNLSDSNPEVLLLQSLVDEGGTDTVAVLIEWILGRMVVHKDVQEKVQEELDNVVGKSRAVMESDIPSLVYLTAVVKEVLRLHPPGPLLSWARIAITDTTIDGYHVPRGTTAMVNMWSIARDPQIWSDPLQFKPERFLSGAGAGGGDVEFSIMGSDLRLAPFGSGRRTCPGKALAWTTVSFWVATLLHEFKWLPSPNQNEAVNFDEVLKLSCEMANPLTVKLSPRRT